MLYLPLVAVTLNCRQKDRVEASGPVSMLVRRFLRAKSLLLLPLLQNLINSSSCNINQNHRGWEVIQNKGIKFEIFHKGVRHRSNCQGAGRRDWLLQLPQPLLQLSCAGFNQLISAVLADQSSADSWLSRSFFRSDKLVGTAQLKLERLENECEIREIVEVRWANWRTWPKRASIL